MTKTHRLHRHLQILRILGQADLLYVVAEDAESNKRIHGLGKYFRRWQFFA